jgi:hypothetical protein
MIHNVQLATFKILQALSFVLVVIVARNPASVIVAVAGRLLYQKRGHSRLLLKFLLVDIGSKRYGNTTLVFVLETILDRGPTKSYDIAISKEWILDRIKPFLARGITWIATSKSSSK